MITHDSIFIIEVFGLIYLNVNFSLCEKIFYRFFFPFSKKIFFLIFFSERWTIFKNEEKKSFLKIFLGFFKKSRNMERWTKAGNNFQNLDNSKPCFSLSWREKIFFWEKFFIRRSI